MDRRNQSERGASTRPGARSRHAARAMRGRPGRAALRGALALACTAAVMLGAGCASGGSGTSDGGPSGGPAGAVPRAAGDTGGGGVESGSGESPLTRQPLPGDDRSRQMAAVDPSSEMVDRIVAVVGDTALLMSEIQQELVRRQAQGAELPQDPAVRDSLMRSIVDQLVEQLVLLNGARSGGVQIPQAEVDRVVESRFQEIRDRFPSTTAFRNAVEQSGQNMFQFRQNLRERTRTEMTIQRFIQQRSSELPPSPISEEEIRRIYEQRFAGRSGPASLSIRRLIVEPEPDSAATERARARADSALAQIRNETPFAVAVRRWSEDTGTRQQEGDLGWVRRSDVIPSFGDAAWNAPLGRPVGPVESEFGFHVLEVQNARGGERKIRHILVKPEIDERDVERARELAAALEDSLNAGADFDRLADRHGDAPANRESAVDVPVQEIGNRLGPAYARALEDPSEGEVVGPIEVSGVRGGTAFAVVKVTGYRPSGAYALDEVRDRIRQQLQRQKQFEQLLERLREDLYVDILM